MQSFHLSLPVSDVNVSQTFYGTKLGLSIGRSGYNWFDIDLYGNQLTFVEVPGFSFKNSNYVLDEKVIPAFHFGILLPHKSWKEMFNLLKGNSFILHEPTVFMEDEVGQHESFFLEDPDGYVLEFKCFRKAEDVFKKGRNEGLRQTIDSGP